MITKKEDYNNVPIHSCKECLSVKIKEVEIKENQPAKDELVSYCAKCGSTDIEKSHVEEWEEKYVEKYGKKFMDGGAK